MENAEEVAAVDAVMAVAVDCTLDGAVRTVVEVDSVEDVVMLKLLLLLLEEEAVLQLQAFGTLADRRRTQRIDD